ncbi:MAG TPA: hypothetical protein VGH16_19240, partial [Candidatus Binatia bacterium]
KHRVVIGHNDFGRHHRAQTTLPGSQASQIKVTPIYTLIRLPKAIENGYCQVLPVYAGLCARPCAVCAKILLLQGN